jgi:hypothetical protein
VVSGCLYVHWPKGARLGTSSSSEIGKRTTADQSFYYESLPPPPKHCQTIVEYDTAADNVDFSPSGDNGNTNSDIIAEESAPSCSVRRLHWKDELTTVSEY